MAVEVQQFFLWEDLLAWKSDQVCGHRDFCVVGLPWMVYMIWSEPSGFLCLRRSKIKSMKAVVGLVTSSGELWRAITVGFVSVTQPDESVEDERRVTDPRRAIIPVPPTADEFWKRKGGTSDNGTGRFIN